MRKWGECERTEVLMVRKNPDILSSQKVNWRLSGFFCGVVFNAVRD